jgi:hypothetical protein
MMPPCDQLPEAFWLDRDHPRHEFEARLRELGIAGDGWIVEAECRECGQRWRVDQPDKYQVDRAIKVPSLKDWTDAEDRRARLGYLKRSFGGDSESACMWAGCPHRALRGIALCAEHAYANGARAKGG